MDLKFEIYLREYHRHTRDEQFILDSMRRDVVFYAGDNNKLKIKILHYDNMNCWYRLDITGWIFDLIVKENPTDTDANAAMIRHVSEIREPLEGEADVDITFLTGEDLLGNYIYQLRATEPANIHRLTTKTILLAEGIMSFKQSLFGE
jgi:hypothetical protein